MSPSDSPSDLSDSPNVPNGQRLQKVLAAAGFGSRRQCEELIEQRRVEVDRQVVDRRGVRVDPDSQEIRVDGEVLKPPRRRYYAVNKPTGVVCTNHDPEGRPRVVDLVHCPQRLFPVGRLDRSSEGLILLTNDGEWTNLLTHPRYGVPKTYLAKVAGHPSREQLQRLREGVHLAEGFAKAESVKVKKRLRGGSLLEIVLREGRNREVRRLLARIGHKVQRLKRTAVGPLRLESLAVGASRLLTEQEVQQLRRASQPRAQASRRRSGSASGTPQQSGRGRGKAKAKARQPSTGAVLDYEAAESPTPRSRAARSAKSQSGRRVSRGKQGQRRKRPSDR